VAAHELRERLALAALRGEDPAEVAAYTAANARRLFGLAPAVSPAS